MCLIGQGWGIITGSSFDRFDAEMELVERYRARYRHHRARQPPLGAGSRARVRLAGDGRRHLARAGA